MPASSFFAKYDRSLFLLLGMVISLSFMLLAFRYQVQPPESTGQPQQPGMAQPIDLDQQLYSQRTPPQANPAPDPLASNDLSPIDLPDLPVLDLPVAILTTSDLPLLPLDTTDEVDLTPPVREVFPRFPGGDAALMAYLKANLRYTSAGIENRIQGVVVLQFVVGADGGISNIRVLRPLGFGLDEEAIRVVKVMPRWEPGYQGGQPVAVTYNLPMRFSLHR
jgi:protein TonB